MPEEDLENNIELLGVTALEDLLQDKVADCIRQFREANIKVWMLTGDKGETAENIGNSCGLIDNKKHRIFKLQGNEKTHLISQIETIFTEIKKMQSSQNSNETYQGQSECAFLV